MTTATTSSRLAGRRRRKWDSLRCAVGSGHLHHGCEDAGGTVLAPVGSPDSTGPAAPARAVIHDARCSSSIMTRIRSPCRAAFTAAQHSAESSVLARPAINSCHAHCDGPRLRDAGILQRCPARMRAVLTTLGASPTRNWNGACGRHPPACKRQNRVHPFVELPENLPTRV